MERTFSDRPTTTFLRSNTKLGSMCESRLYLDFGTGKTKRDSFLPNKIGDDNVQKTISRKSPVMYGATVPLLDEDGKKHVTRFITGSRYIGEWNRLGFSGKGIYRYPHGVLYDGYFNRDGEFHGCGILIYPNGQRVEGLWKNGKLLNTGAHFISKENSMYADDYCKMPDRRFDIEIHNGLSPAGQEYLTNAPKARRIPEGCYDAGDKFYDPTLRVMRAYDTLKITCQENLEADNLYWLDDERKAYYESVHNLAQSEHNFTDLLTRWKIKRNYSSFIEPAPVSNKEEWIEKNCRRAWSISTAYKPELYEIWTSGARKDEDENVLYDDNFPKEEIKVSLVSSMLNSTDYSIVHSTIQDLETSICLGTIKPIMRKTSNSSLKALSTMFINRPNSSVPRPKVNKNKLKIRTTTHSPKLRVTEEKQTIFKRQRKC